jgi:hypothetical protein
MGVGRSLPGLLQLYNATQTEPPEKAQNRPKPTETDRYCSIEPPTRSIATLKMWSAKYDWKARAGSFDRDWEETRNARRRVALSSGYANDFERLTVLNDLAQMIYGHIAEQSEPADNTSVQNAPSRRCHNLWVPDVKMIGVGDCAEPFYYERFNAALLSEFRSLLAEIAQETGGRRKGANVEAFLKRLHQNLDRSRLTQPQLDRLANGEHWVEVLLEPYMNSD